MQRAKWAGTLLVSVVVWTSACSDVLGQELGSGRTIITPGNIVSDGLGRAQAAVRDPLASPQITETPETIATFDNPSDPVTIRNPDRLVSDAIRQLAVNALTQLFATIANNFLTSIGLPALFPTDFLTSTPDLSSLVQAGGTGQTGGSTDAAQAGDTTTSPPSGTMALPDTGTSDTSGGRSGRNGNRPRG